MTLIQTFGAGLAYLLVGAMAGTAANAQPGEDLGRREYMSSCAACHGAGGKGDGPMKAWLTKAPSDLTTLAKRNGGAVPAQLVWEMIDGRSSKEIGPHGSREMAVWGDVYRAQALADPKTATAPEWYVRGRIVALIDYLQRIQGK